MEEGRNARAVSSRLAEIEHTNRFRRDGSPPPLPPPLPLSFLLRFLPRLGRSSIGSVGNGLKVQDLFDESESTVHLET